MVVRARSEELFAEALRFIPGGVNSPVRAFRAVGGCLAEDRLMLLQDVMDERAQEDDVAAGAERRVELGRPRRIDSPVPPGTVDFITSTLSESSGRSATTARTRERSASPE